MVAGHSTARAATIGGLLAFQIQNLGIAGLVTDGLVRDVQEIRQLGLPVWCRGTTPLAPKKGGPGVVGGIVVIGGVVVQDGDLVIADDDGVVVWPKNDIPALLARAQAKLEADNERLARLRQVAGQKRSENEGQPLNIERLKVRGGVSARI